MVWGRLGLSSALVGKNRWDFLIGKIISAGWKIGAPIRLGRYHPWAPVVAKTSSPKKLHVIHPLQNEWPSFLGHIQYIALGIFSIDRRRSEAFQNGRGGANNIVDFTGGKYSHEGGNGVGSGWPEK